MSKPEIFISFSTKDLKECEELLMQLDNKYCNYWYQKKIGIGEQYKDLIKQKIDSSIACIFLLSKNFLESDFIKDMELPWIEDKNNGSLIYDVIPIQIEECNWESINLLSGIQIYPSKTSEVDLKNKNHINMINGHIKEYLNNAGYVRKRGWFR